MHQNTKSAQLIVVMRKRTLSKFSERTICLFRNNHSNNSSNNNNDSSNNNDNNNSSSNNNNDSSNNNDSNNNNNNNNNNKTKTKTFNDGASQTYFTSALHFYQSETLITQVQNS